MQRALDSNFDEGQVAARQALVGMAAETVVADAQNGGALEVVCYMLAFDKALEVEADLDSSCSRFRLVDCHSGMSSRYFEQADRAFPEIGR